MHSTINTVYVVLTAAVWLVKEDTANTAQTQTAAVSTQILERSSQYVTLFNSTWYPADSLHNQPCLHKNNKKKLPLQLQLSVGFMLPLIPQYFDVVWILRRIYDV